MTAMRERAVQPILHAITAGVRVVHAHTCLIVAEVITALCVARCAVQIWTLVSIRANACGLVVFRAVVVRAVVESPIPPADGPPASLVHKVPVEARKRAMLRAFVLEEQRALLDAELLQIRVMIRFLRLGCQQRLRL